jgi:hypothetical protein
MDVRALSIGYGRYRITDLFYYTAAMPAKSSDLAAGSCSRPLDRTAKRVPKPETMTTGLIAVGRRPNLLTATVEASSIAVACALEPIFRVV